MVGGATVSLTLILKFIGTVAAPPLARMIFPRPLPRLSAGRVTVWLGLFPILLYDARNTLGADGHGWPGSPGTSLHS
jgi:hypothetical protein